MEKRNENLLNDFLKTAFEEGYATVRKWMLLHWYGQTNLTVAIRRDLRDRWKALVEEADSKAPLRIGEAHGNILLANGDIFFSKDA